MITESTYERKDAACLGTVAIIKIKLMRDENGDFLSSETRLPIEGSKSFESYPNRFNYLNSDELSSPVLVECAKLIQHISTIIPKE